LPYPHAFLEFFWCQTKMDPLWSREPLI
jgi:hypothetical protein